MDLVTTTDLKSLARPAERGPAVSLFSPTQRIVTDAGADPLRWKNLLIGVTEALHEQGMSRNATDELLGPAWDQHADTLAWQHMSDGLAMFLRPDWHRTFRVPVEVSHIGTVGDRFVISPLLGAVSGEEHFLMLTVSQRKVRLLEGTRHRVEEVELSEVPTSLGEVVEPPDPRSHTMARPANRAGRGGPAIFYGHGAADDSYKKDEVTRFLRVVADGLQPQLAKQFHPMVLVGLEELVGIYREVNTYASVLVRSVDHNPDELSAEELHEAAWPIVEEHLEQDKRSAIERFGELNGTGRASTDPAEIEQASSEGRVDALFLADGPSCWDALDAREPRIVSLGSDGDSRGLAACEQLDRTVVATLINGGAIHAVPDEPLLDGASVAATFRY